eukprot:TRINITY_DN29043_c0_g2_i1.p2 TRINITY_DN29043_c0_g2~~TRINITY_DN29043_c0_g2_i1.p2  ORF type:complete len:112 (-),score=31.65 TRINITY_DN29043_c0_g2_i1:285-620(-)
MSGGDNRAWAADVVKDAERRCADLAADDTYADVFAEFADDERRRAGKGLVLSRLPQVSLVSMALAAVGLLTAVVAFLSGSRDMALLFIACICSTVLYAGCQQRAPQHEKVA